MSATIEASLWQRILDDAGRPSPESADYLLRLDFRDDDHDRMAELAAKSTDGSLTDDERAEYQELVRVGHVLAILQSKARVALRHAAVAGRG